MLRPALEQAAKQPPKKWLLGTKNDSRPTKAQIWSIGIYASHSPFVFSPAANNPVLTSQAVTDVGASFVADPFMAKVQDVWHMFFEVMNSNTGRGEIGLAVSQDAIRWTYRQIVLREDFHLSYPYVFEWDNEFYMVPESYQAKAVRLYKAFDFPTRWSFVRNLLAGDDFADSSIFRFDDRWWLLTELAGPPYYAGILRLFSAENLMGPWVEHPKSPVIDGNPHIARPAGRVLVVDGRVIRHTQDCDPIYGSQVRAFEITELTTTSYHEREVDTNPILTASGAGWNQSGMHHIDSHPVEGGKWMACVDGFLWQDLEHDLNVASKLQSKPVLSIKQHLRRYKPYIVASEIKAVLKKHLKGANNHIEAISLKPEKPSRGNVLFSYVTDAFTLSAGQTVPYSHPAYWESLQMAKTYLDFGYSVDVISAADGGGFFPEKHYAVFVGHRHNFERIARQLNTDCVKVLHCDVAHWLFHNNANTFRYLALQRRKKITLPQLKVQAPNLAIERADCATILGNEFTIGTYRYANKPIYRIPISAPALYPWPAGKDFETCRRRFLWFGSNGFVHKGLDLVLEAFAAMPEYHLTVCGPIKDEVEKDFEKTFYKELYQTSNIRTVGWVDVASAEFIEIANNSVGLVYPSCSEGQCGGVVTCLHAGLLPLISCESGVDVDDFGFLLHDGSIENIRDSVRMVASLPAQKLEKRARKAWEFVRANHTREKFADEYSKVVGTILSTYGCDADFVGSVRHKRFDRIADTHRYPAGADLLTTRAGRT